MENKDLTPRKSIIDGYCCDEHPPCYTDGDSAGWHNCPGNTPPDGHGCEDSSNYCPSAECSTKLAPGEQCTNCPTNAAPFASNWTAHASSDGVCCDGAMQADPCPASSQSDPHVNPFHGDPYDL